MLKFKLNARELKEMMEKAATVINKKSCLPALSRLYFQIDENEHLKIWGTNMEHWLEVRSENIYDTQPGVVFQHFLPVPHRPKCLYRKRFQR